MREATLSKPDPATTRFYAEASETADVVRRQLRANAAAMQRIGEKLRQLDPPLIVTCARGSSDHAATYAKYLLESSSGVFTASAAPSIHSVYGQHMKFDGTLCLCISQSGASPDLLAVARAARDGGAYVLALVNVADSPLTAFADDVVELRAGPESSVAATKSFVASLAAIAHLAVCWCDDAGLRTALRDAPALLGEAWRADWSAALDALSGVSGLYVLGRGIGLGVAQEAALKLKETCGLHAEAFSAAEVLHGPIAIAGKGFPVLVFAQDDATLPGIRELVAELAGIGTTIVAAGLDSEHAVSLPVVGAHPAVEPLLRIQSFYRLAADLALRLGLDPDHPPYLQKVTVTV